MRPVLWAECHLSFPRFSDLLLVTRPRAGVGVDHGLQP